MNHSIIYDSDDINGEESTAYDCRLSIFANWKPTIRYIHPLEKIKMILNSTIVSWNKESFEELKVIRVEIFSWKLNVTIIPIRWKLRSNPKSKKSITSCTSRKLSFATYAVSRDRAFTIDIDFIQFVSANYY